MFNLVKYELKGYYKEFIIMFSAIILLHLLLFTRINTWNLGSIVLISFLTSFTAAVIIVVWNIQLFSRDMYSDSGYLLFTLPQKGYSILGSKILTSMFQFIIIGIICLSFNYITIKMCNIPELSINYVSKYFSKNFITFMITSSIFNYIYFLLIVYFSIALSKIAIKNKKLGKLGTFIIFIAICIFIGKATEIIWINFPLDIDLNFFSNELSLTVKNLYQHQLSVNIPVIIFNILTAIGLFIGGSYILENKIDL